MSNKFYLQVQITNPKAMNILSISILKFFASLSIELFIIFYKNFLVEFAHEIQTLK